MGNVHAKTHEHVKNDYAKTHGLAIAKVSQYLRGDKYEGNNWKNKE